MKYDFFSPLKTNIKHDYNEIGKYIFMGIFHKKIFYGISAFSLIEISQYGGLRLFLGKDTFDSCKI